MDANTKISVKKAAALKGCHPHTIYRAIDRGDLPAEQIDGFMYLLRPTDVDKWEKRPRGGYRRKRPGGTNA